MLPRKKQMLFLSNKAKHQLHILWREYYYLGKKYQVNRTFCSPPWFESALKIIFISDCIPPFTVSFVTDAAAAEIAGPAAQRGDISYIELKAYLTVLD